MARRRVFNRIYHPDWPDEGVAVERRPWVAKCVCPWATFHRTQRQAFGYAVRHSCQPMGFR